MQPDLPILDRINAELRHCQVAAKLRTKLTGALAVEVIREQLISGQLPVSCRDVFIQGVPTEFDLFVTRPSANPRYGLIYQPNDVLAILEIKYSGVYNGKAVPRLRRLFDDVVRAHRHIQCFFLALWENKKYKHKATSEALKPHLVHTAYWHNWKLTEFTATGDWERLVESLQDVFRNAVRADNI